MSKRGYPKDYFAARAVYPSSTDPTYSLVDPSVTSPVVAPAKMDTNLLILAVLAICFLALIAFMYAKGK